ncbi:hypothetical protein [Pseudooceanicola sp.]|uniref:hypothetical protein n=1 Tax=Pseudooceanicola sp. TaxID=1914328 RepID=UPI0026077685|nr:hypothetical protein [Pseudooceanicola sp.]MDF1854572.1 hypothetical protein [Pseudooceanicola sp.]
MPLVINAHRPSHYLNIAIAGILALGILLIAAVARAGGEDNDNDPGNEAIGAYAEGGKRTYSQSEFLKLDRRDYAKLVAQRREKDDRVVIEGFSPNMTTWIIYGAAVDHRAMRRLLREMAQIKGTKARQKRLWYEWEKTRNRSTC